MIYIQIYLINVLNHELIEKKVIAVKDKGNKKYVKKYKKI